ncbi:MAG: TIGR03936 family radical SAM-associated protein, partial [Desulfovibrio sp.]|nr:TIGR03936 family radical SAM-associated protein [Desulfovibrio sp.]
LRAVINKGITEEDLMRHARRLLEYGWRQVKLYFMIGLPTETDEDLLAILDLCRKTRDAGGPGSARLRVTASLSPFVPKAHTPFQREAQISLEEMRRRKKLVLDAAKKEKLITVRGHDPEMSLLEGILARGDRRTADVVERAYRKGAVFSSWKEGFSLQPWLEALSELGLNAEDYTRERAPDEVLPWDHLASGVAEEFLRREKDRALRALPTPDCRYAACNGCGVCGVPGRSSGLQQLPGRTGRYGVKLNRPQRDSIGVKDKKAPAASPHPAGIDLPAGVSGSAAGAHSENRAVPETFEKNRTVLEASEKSRAASEKDAAPDPAGERRVPSGATGRQKPPELPEHLVLKAAQILVRYSRMGPAAYLSQLEIQRIFDRALRRAGVPLAFSRGFHPLPLLSFGRALPVGVESESEWFSLYLRAPCSVPDVPAALNAGLPRGIRVLSAESLSLARQSADAERECFRLECLDARDDEFLAAWERIRQSTSLPWLKAGKKKVRSLDARPFFVHIETLPSGTAQATACMKLILDWSSGGYVSPLALCVHALAGVGFTTDPTGLRLMKTGLSERCPTLSRTGAASDRQPCVQAEGCAPA